VYSVELERGKSPLNDRQTRRARHAIDRGNRGNMIRAVAYAAG